jgi:hypothetical protein
MGPTQFSVSITARLLPPRDRPLHLLLHITGDGGGPRFKFPFSRRSLNLGSTPPNAVDNEEDEIGGGYGTAENGERNLVSVLEEVKL